jgi:Flp pilus assembly CpaE family ATPase
MPASIRLLVLSADSRIRSGVEKALGGELPHVSVLCLREPALALPRVAGGDIDAMLIHPGSIGLSGSALRDFLGKLEQSGRVSRIILLGEEEQREFIGASGARLLRPSPRWEADLKEMIVSQRDRTTLSDSSARGGRIVGFLGVKGGAGTTTIALNVACSLAGTGPVLLAEMGRHAGSIGLFVRARHSSLGRSRAIPSVLGRLCDVEEVPGLDICLALPQADKPESIVAAADAALLGLGAAGDRVVLDLGSQLAEPVTSAIPRLDLLALVLERDSVSVECARRLRNTLESRLPGDGPALQWIVVNRSVLACPLDLDEIQAAVNAESLEVVPPDADLCYVAQKARVPVVVFSPASLWTQSVRSIAQRIAPRSGL